jgi:hypothetical protein
MLRMPLKSVQRAHVSAEQIVFPSLQSSKGKRGAALKPSLAKSAMSRHNPFGRNMVVTLIFLQSCSAGLQSALPGSATRPLPSYLPVDDWPMW